MNDSIRAANLCVFSTAVTDGATIGSAYTPPHEGVLRLSCVFSAAAKLQVLVTRLSDSATDTGLLNAGDNLVADTVLNDALSVSPGYSYTLRPSGDDVTVAYLEATLVRGGVL